MRKHCHPNILRHYSYNKHSNNTDAVEDILSHHIRLKFVKTAEQKLLSVRTYLQLSLNQDAVFSNGMGKFFILKSIVNNFSDLSGRGIRMGNILATKFLLGEFC